MSWKMFFIMLFVNIVILYPFIQWEIAKPKIEVYSQKVFRNLTPNDQSAFGNAEVKADGTYLDKKYNGLTLKQICPNGVIWLDFLPDGKGVFNCK